MNVTYSLNDETMKQINELAEKLYYKKSTIVQLAVKEFYERFKKGIK